ncbi:unnamed protein product [Pleuronectes platessa]|uniref:Uncharacterized protein n=1 Tax=Pleuronectes platessa TaxID=8262 RepID=A0A9N7UTS7_PLEPL|nr:unnamed protein product [Pleuronectes platessa]
MCDGRTSIQRLINLISKKFRAALRKNSPRGRKRSELSRFHLPSRRHFPDATRAGTLASCKNPSAGDNPHRASLIRATCTVEDLNIAPVTDIMSAVQESPHYAFSKPSFPSEASNPRPSISSIGIQPLPLWKLG